MKYKNPFCGYRRLTICNRENKEKRKFEEDQNLG